MSEFEIARKTERSSSEKCVNAEKSSFATEATGVGEATEREELLAFENDIAADEAGCAFSRRGEETAFRKCQGVLILVRWFSVMSPVTAIKEVSDDSHSIAESRWLPGLKTPSSSANRMRGEEAWSASKLRPAGHPKLVSLRIRLIGVPWIWAIGNGLYDGSEPLSRINTSRIAQPVT